MSLTFGGAASDRINCGSGASHDNITAGTVALIAYPTSVGVAYDPRFFQKGLFAGGDSRFLTFVRASSRLEGLIQRSTTSIDAIANLSDFSAWALSTWMLVAFTWNDAGASTDQRLYVGNQTTAPAEPSSYTTQQVGSGTTSDDSARDWILGNNQNNGNAFIGEIAVQGVWSRQLSAADLAAWFKNPTEVGANLVMLHSIGSNGTDTQFDYSGNANAGTVTGATVSTNKPPTGLWTPVINPLYNGAHRRTRRPALLGR